ENAAETAEMSTKTSIARVTRASHTRRANELFVCPNEMAKSAVRPRVRNANCAHGAPVPQGVKPIAAISVVNATRLERELPNGEISPRSEVCIAPPLSDSPALSVL